MRRIALTLTMLATLAAAGCNNQNATNNQAAKGPATSVSGTVGLMQPREVSQQASMKISLVDVSTDGAAPLATKTVSPVAAMPVHFQLDFDPAKINKADLYVVRAEMTDGERQFSMPVQAPVITRGAPTQVAIKLVAEKTAAEKMLDAFNKKRQHIGGLKVTSGTSLEKDVSRGWQTFRSNESGDIEFVRELADYGDKGFTSTDYAYQGGKPWVVEQQHKPSQNAKPTSIDRAGWDAEGNLVLKQHVAGGKTTALSADTAAELRKHAEAMFKTASRKK